MPANPSESAVRGLPGPKAPSGAGDSAAQPCEQACKHRPSKLVEVSGIEPPASSLRTTRSSQLSYTPVWDPAR